MNDQLKEIKFFPDFSLTLREKCIYAKVTRQNYIKAVKSNFLEKKVLKEEILSNNFSVGRMKKANKEDTQGLLKNINININNNNNNNNNNNHSHKNGQFKPIDTTAENMIHMSDDETTNAFLLSNKI